MNKIELTGTQKYIAWENSQVTAMENSQVIAWENSQVTAMENSQVIAWGNSQVTAWGNSQVTGRGNSQVTAWGNSQVTARENSQVTARENSQVTAWENSQVTAWGNSQVTAWENSQVTARENSQVTAWENSQVTARENSFIRVYRGKIIIESVSVVVMVMPGFDGKIINKNGATVIYVPVIDTAEKWLSFYGVSIRNGKAILYKAVDDDYSTDKARSAGIFYKPGLSPKAPDWNPIPECGGGLHFCGHPQFALDYNEDAVRFVACPILVSEILLHYPAEYPNKVKAPRVAGKCYEVDRNGNRIK